MAISWFIKNWVELFGVVSAMVYLYLSIKQNIWLWPWGALSSAIYIVIYFKSKFYADMGLQVYYLAISFYGWYAWLHHKKGRSKIELSVTSINVKPAILLLIISILLQVVMALILKHFTDSPVPWGDAFTTAFAITATWMLARKIMEHWLVWVVVDAVAMILYINRELYLTAFLFLVYTIMALVGYYEWRKEWRKTQQIPQ